MHSRRKTRVKLEARNLNPLQTGKHIRIESARRDYLLPPDGSYVA